MRPYLLTGPGIDGGDPLGPARPYRRPLAPPAPARPRPTTAAPSDAATALAAIRAAADIAAMGRFAQAAAMLADHLRRVPDSPQALGMRLQLATLLLGGEHRRALPELRSAQDELERTA